MLIAQTGLKNEFSALYTLPNFTQKNMQTLWFYNENRLLIYIVKEILKQTGWVPLSVYLYRPRLDDSILIYCWSVR